MIKRAYILSMFFTTFSNTREIVDTRKPILQKQNYAFMASLCSHLIPILSWQLLSCGVEASRYRLTQKNGLIIGILLDILRTERAGSL